MFAHLLFTDAISWQVMANIRLTEEDTTSSSRIFLKILFQEMAEYMGLSKLNLRLKDPSVHQLFFKHLVWLYVTNLIFLIFSF
jgi:pre-mRNA-splicing factor CWC22